MWKKISIQAILFSLVVFLILFTYKIYFKDDEIYNAQEKIIINPENIQLEDSEAPNLVQDLRYVSRDILGNEFIINSKYSELNLESANIINMKDVSAKIVMLNKEPMFVKSKFATYNNMNYETNFFGDVVVNYLDSKINSEKFEISIKDNFAQVSEKVIYQNQKIKLEADIIEIDLITKNSKIFMIDKHKKIKIINK